ncbi:MAG: redoxin domain-containing protein [Gemmatimonadota bacterium]
MRKALLHGVAILALATAASSLADAQKAASVPVTNPLPAASNIKTATEASALLRRLFYLGEQYDGVALGDTLTRRFPRDARLRAWYIANLGTASRLAVAESIAARIDTTSRDPWNVAARAFAKRYALGSSKAAVGDVLRLAQRARSLAPKDPDIAALVTSVLNPGTFGGGSPAAVVAFVDSVAPRLGNPPALRVARAQALMEMSSPRTPNAPPDTAKRNAANREYAAIRADDPSNFAARLSGGIQLRQVDEAGAFALLKEAVEIAPRAPNPRMWVWVMIQGQRGVSAEEKKTAILANRTDFLARTDSAPWAMDAMLGQMRGPSPDADVPLLEERILAKAPRSPWAENILLARANQWRDSLFIARDSTRPGPKSDTTTVRARYIAAIEAFIDKPWVANPTVRDQAVTSLFYEVRADSTYPTNKLIALVKRVVAIKGPVHPSTRYGQTARALATRKVEFRYAEQLAREGAGKVAHYVGDLPNYSFSSVGEQADVVDAGQASVYDDLGFSLFNEGRYDDADKALTHALDLTKKNVNIYYDLGRLRAAQGRDEDAELTYAQGMTVRSYGVANPNKKELERLYQKKHGSLDGWDTYVSALEDKERATRKERILSKRLVPPPVVPAFKLPDLDGTTVDSDKLRSQVIVVNFWGMWCGPCVAEMPELQQFYDKYKNDKSVTILTVSNDKDLKELKEWMAKRKLTIPTLFDDGYVTKSAQINSFPTTWFIDREGKTQFSVTGNTGALVEEWTWRIEATKAPQVVP